MEYNRSKYEENEKSQIEVSKFIGIWDKVGSQDFKSLRPKIISLSKPTNSPQSQRSPQRLIQELNPINTSPQSCPSIHSPTKQPELSLNKSLSTGKHPMTASGDTIKPIKNSESSIHKPYSNPETNTKDYSYSEQGQLLIEYIQNTLKSDYSMSEYFLPLEEKYASSPKTNIFLSNSIKSPSHLLILIQGAGEVRPGIWSRSVCLTDDIDLGSMIPLVSLASAQNWVTLIMNPNLTHDEQTYKPVPLLNSREAHGQYVWERFVQSNNLPIFIVAHSCGGVSVNDLISKYPEDFINRVKKIAFTDAVISEHRFGNRIKSYLESHSIHWITSSRPGNSLISSYGIPERSCGHTKHEYATGCAFEYIKEYFLE